MRPIASVVSAGNMGFTPAELFNCCMDLKEPDWKDFTNLELGGCVDAAGEGPDETCIEGGESREHAQFFTVYGHLSVGGCEAITDSDAFDDAQAVAARLCELSGLTLIIHC